METTQEETTDSVTKPPVRKTRSGRIVRPPPPSKSPKTPGKKTRKKMVLMEVEVSDEEDAVPESEPLQEADGADSNTSSQEKENGKPVNEADRAENESADLELKGSESHDVSEHTDKVEVDDNKKISALEEAIESNINDLHSVEENDTEDRNDSPVRGKRGKKTDLPETKLAVVALERIDSQSVAANSCQKKSKIPSSELEADSPSSNKLDDAADKTSDGSPPSKRLKTLDSAEDQEADGKIETPEYTVGDQEKMEADVEQMEYENKVTKTDALEETSAEKEEKISDGGCKDESKKDGDGMKASRKKKDGEKKDKEKHGKEKRDKDKREKEKHDKGKQDKERRDKQNDDADTKAGKPDKAATDDKSDRIDETSQQEIAEAGEDEAENKMDVSNKDNCDPDTENISEDELPGVQVAKVPETEEVSDEELPGPKRAELPADTEVVSEDELPTVKKDPSKRKLNEGEYDPGSPTSEHEAPTKKPALEASTEKEKEDKPSKPKKLPELDKYWKAVNDDPTDFTGWTYLLQYVDQENDMEAAREAYDAFLSHYPYCYGYWRKYADYEKRKGNKKKCEEVFERGFKAIPLSVDLWIHYMTYVKTTRAEDEEFIRSQFERALAACGLEFRSDRLWDSYIKWETEGKRPQKVTAIYDRLLATPTQGYSSHFDNFQEHITSNAPNKVVEVDEFLALRKEVRHSLKQHESPSEDNSDAPPGDEDPSKIISSDEETKAIRERIISIRRKMHKNTSAAVTARWNFEEGIKRPYFHVKPLERCQLKNWQDYLEYEMDHGDKARTIVLFERCLIACALYEEFWLKFVHYLEGLKDPEVQPKIRDVYERACTIHHLKKPNLHLQWAVFEESIQNYNKAAEILVNLERSVPNVLQIAYRRINLERRRGDHEKCSQLYEHYMNNSKSKVISGNIAIKYSRFSLKILKSMEKASEVLKNAITKDPTNPRLYLQLIDLTLQREGVPEKEVTDLIDSYLEKEGVEPEQKVLFAQRKLEFLEDFGSDIQTVQKAYEDYQKFIKQNKEAIKKKEAKSEPTAPSKKDSKPAPPSAASNTYGNYSNYGNSGQGSYQYSGSQGQYGYPQYGQGDQYQYQGWQYQQGNYGGYNQWGSYGGGYGY